MNIKYLLFDLGGVLVELAGVSRMLELMGGKVDEEGMWKKWICSSSIRSYETGKLSTQEFGEIFVKEFELDICANEFIKEFAYFPKCMFPGTAELLKEVGAKYPTAILSNTNELHWDRLAAEFELEKLVTRCFLSHKIGIMKPDSEAFQYVIKELGCEPGEIVFFDDNQINVDAACSAGMRAYRVVGLEGLKVELGRLGIK